MLGFRYWRESEDSSSLLPIRSCFQLCVHFTTYDVSFEPSKDEGNTLFIRVTSDVEFCTDHPSYVNGLTPEIEQDIQTQGIQHLVIEDYASEMHIGCVVDWLFHVKQFPSCEGSVKIQTVKSRNQLFLGPELAEVARHAKTFDVSSYKIYGCCSEFVIAVRENSMLQTLQTSGAIPDELTKALHALN